MNFTPFVVFRFIPGSVTTALAVFRKLVSKKKDALNSPFPRWRDPPWATIKALSPASWMQSTSGVRR